jgi:hypothetical protein
VAFFLAKSCVDKEARVCRVNEACAACDEENEVCDVNEGLERQKSTPCAQNDLFYAIALARRTAFFREPKEVYNLPPPVP